LNSTDVGEFKKNKTKQKDYQNCTRNKESEYQQYIAMYYSGCQICCNWSRLKPGFTCQHTEVPCHRYT